MNTWFSVFSILCTGMCTPYIYGYNSSSSTNVETVLDILNEQKSDSFLLSPLEASSAPQMWSEILQNITLSHSEREAKASTSFSPMYQKPHINHPNPYRRVGEAPPLRIDNHFTPSSNRRQSPINFGNRLISPNDVSETDLYLLSAIEKLVYRVDYLEKRMQKTDTLVLHLLKQINENKQQQMHHPSSPSTPPTSSVQQHTKPITTVTEATSPQASDCPKDFTRISTSCYHIETKTPTDWQTASQRCKANSARLAEFSQPNVLKTVEAHLMNSLGNEKVDLWLGALNPGLLWIWSSSAQPVMKFNESSIVDPDKSTSIQSAGQGAPDIAGKGRCLNLRSNETQQHLQYYGEDCSKLHSYICEFHDRTIENTISRVLRALHLE